jgi:hypothetical protein
LSGGIVISNAASYTAAAAVRRRFGGFWFDAGYTRTLTSTSSSLTATTGSGRAGGAGALLGNVLFETATIGVAGDWRRFGMDVRLTGSLAESARIPDPRNFFQVRRFNDIHSGIVRARFDYELSERFTIFTTYDYYGQNENELSLQALGRSRYLVGLEFWIFPEARQARPTRTGDPVGGQ